jgi:hypothetical protein
MGYHADTCAAIVLSVADEMDRGGHELTDEVGYYILLYIQSV